MKWGHAPISPHHPRLPVPEYSIPVTLEELMSVNAALYLTEIKLKTADMMFRRKKQHSKRKLYVLQRIFS